MLKIPKFDLANNGNSAATGLVYLGFGHSCYPRWPTFLASVDLPHPTGPMIQIAYACFIEGLRLKLSELAHECLRAAP